MPTPLTGGANVSHSLALFVAQQHDLPGHVMEQAKLHIADTVACIVSGAGRDSARILGSLYRLTPGVGNPLDALLLGTRAHADDFDDTSETSMNGHPSAAVTSALLAAAGRTSATGAAVIEAYSVGVEVACKLGRVMGLGHAARGWHTMSTLGTVGAAAACARLAGLDEQACGHALSISASLAGGLLANTGTMVKSLHCGHAAWAGALSAVLAGSGFDAGHAVFDQSNGFVSTFGGNLGSGAAVADLGLPWELLHPGIDIKLYPSCSCTHGLIDAALQCRAEHGARTAEIREIRCGVSEECSRYLVFEIPSSAIEAKFSAPYCVAVALSRGWVQLSDFTLEAISSADVAGLMSRVRLEPQPDGEPECVLQVSYADGSRRAYLPRPPVSVGWPEVERKFRDCADGALTETDTRQVFERLRHLEAVGDFGATLSPVTQVNLPRSQSAQSAGEVLR